MAGLNFDIQIGAGRRRREQQALQMAKELLDQGLKPNEINQAVNNFVKTGEVNLPTERTVALPPVADIPERSTRQPIEYGKKKKRALFSLDEATGQFSQQEVPDDVDDFSVAKYNSAPYAGEDIFVDPSNASEVSRIPNRRRDNRTKVLPKPNQPRAAGSGGSGKDSPDVALAKDTIKKGQLLIAKGEGITPEFVRSFKEAADFLEIPYEELDVPQGFVAKFFGMTPDKEMPTLKFDGQGQGKPAPVNEAELREDVEKAKKAIAAKLVPPEEALKRLQKKYGNRIPSL